MMKLSGEGAWVARGWRGPRHPLGSGCLWCQVICSCQVGSERGKKAGPLWNRRRQVPQLQPHVRREPGGRLHATGRPIFSPDPPKSQTWGQQALGPQKQALTMWPANMVGVLCVFRPVVT